LPFIGVLASAIKTKKSYSPNDQNNRSFRGFAYTLLASVFMAVAFLIDKQFSKSFSLPTYLCFQYLFSATLLIPFVFPRRKIVFTLLQTKLPLLTTTAALGAVYYYLTLLAMRTTDASIVIPLMELSSIIAIFGGIFLLQEKSNLKLKSSSAFLVIIGSIVLTL
jgi:drug/metabolite transporter (DMT)-like permease